MSKIKNIFRRIMPLIVYSGLILAVSAGLSVRYNLDSDWESGFQGSMTIVNETSNTIDNWKLEFEYPYTINSIWNAQKESYISGVYTIKPPNWKTSLLPNESYTFGFLGVSWQRNSRTIKYKTERSSCR